MSIGPPTHSLARRWAALAPTLISRVTFEALDTGGSHSAVMDVNSPLTPNSHFTQTGEHDEKAENECRKNPSAEPDAPMSTRHIGLRIASWSAFERTQSSRDVFSTHIRSHQDQSPIHRVFLQRHHWRAAPHLKTHTALRRPAAVFPPCPDS